MTLITPFPTFHYHPHQEEGIQWMLERERDGSFCHGGILADEMGLGKTWETIGLLLNNPLRHTLLLVPPVLQQQWIDALKLAGICICVLRSESHEMGPWYIVDGERKDVYVLLATYDRAAASVEHILEAAEIDRIVADEGHTFRNDKTRRFKILSQIKAKCRWILSGTPVQNRVNDFHNLLTWLNEDYVKENYVLHEIAAKLILRRTAAEVREAVPEFPECKPLHFIHPVAYVDGTKEKKVFDTLVQRFKYVIEHQMEQWMVLELYLRIRQFTAHPQIYYDAMHKKYPEQARIVWEETCSKTAALKTLLGKFDKRPTLAFTNFRDEMHYAEECFTASGYTCFRISGGMTDAARTKAIEGSRKAASEGIPTVMFVQIQAGNAGINLQHLTRIVFLSSHWNPSVVDQAVGRSYRIGQKEQVEVHHILLADGAVKNIDRYMARIHKEKRGHALAIHDKLFCDSAIDTAVIMQELNAVCKDEMSEEEMKAEVEAIRVKEAAKVAKAAKAAAKEEAKAAKAAAKEEAKAAKAAAKEEAKAAKA